MSERRKAGVATAATGAGLVAGGGQLRGTAIRHARELTGRKSFVPSHDIWHARSFPRNKRRMAMWGGGVALQLAGAPAVGVGVNEARKRDDRPHLLTEGVQGTRDAVRAKASNIKSDTPARARAAGVATSAASGLTGSFVAHRILDHVAPNIRARPAITALGGTAATVSSLPLANRVTRRVAPGYEVTSTGVKRKKTPPVRPTSRAAVVETRANRGARPDARSRIVPSDTRVGKDASTTMDYPGAGMTPGQKRARVMAAGGIPVIGDITAASQAARMAPPDQRRSAFASQIGGSIGGSALGAAGGAYGAAALARHNPQVRERAEQAQNQINRARAAAASRTPGGAEGRVGRLVAGSEGPGRIARTIGTLEGHSSRPVARIGEALGHAYKPLAGAGAAAALGGAVGQMAGGQAGGYTGYSLALHREKERADRLSKIGKAAGDTSLLSRQEQVRQLRRKQHNLGWSMANTGVGAAGTGLFVGSLVAKHPLKPKLERAALGTAIGGGTIGSITGAKQVRTTHRDLQAEEARLRRQGVVKAAGFRASTIASRRTRSGVLVPVRRANTVVRKISKARVPGGWKPTSALTGTERQALRSRASGVRPNRTPLSGRGRHGIAGTTENMGLSALNRIPTSPSGRKNINFGSGVHEGNRQQLLDALPKRARRPVTIHADGAPAGTDAITYGRAGTRRPSHVLTRPGAHPYTVRHEFEHSQPRRGYHRLADPLQNDPVRRAGEEARADARTVRVRGRDEKIRTDYEAHAVIAREAERGNPAARKTNRTLENFGATSPEYNRRYTQVRERAGSSIRGVEGFDVKDPASPFGQIQADAARRSAPSAPRQKMRQIRRRFGKADIQRTLSDEDVKRYSTQYGTRGPLPKQLDRNERMRAYEARYVASGGPKGEKWKHRAAMADRVTGGALAVGGAGAAAELAGRTQTGRQVLHRLGVAPHRLEGIGSKAGLTAGALGAGSELFHRHAQRRQASYSASPAGVAASSLRRMQNYTPQED